jgi:hypothetical protein
LEILALYSLLQKLICLRLRGEGLRAYGSREDNPRQRQCYEQWAFQKDKKQKERPP